MSEKDNNKKLVIFSEIKLNIGDSIQLHDTSNTDNERLFVKLIGYRMNQSLLVTMPQIEGRELSVYPGQNFVVRLFSVKTVHAFTATVLEAKRTPYPYMHLSYPSRVESVVVRNAQRVNVSLIVSVKNDDPDKNSDASISANLSDISTGGAKLSTNEAIGELGDDISLSAKLTVGGVEQYIQILAIIRRIDIHQNGDQNKQEMYHYGLEFRFVEENERLILHGFVYEQLSNK